MSRKPTVEDGLVAIQDEELIATHGKENLQLMTIRLPKQMVEDFRLMAGDRGMGYQKLMREVLQDAATAQMREIAMDYLAQKAKKRGDHEGS